MPTNSADQPALPAKATGIGDNSPDQELISRFVQTQEVDIRSLLPSQVETGIKLQERQEETRSNLAKFLIKMLAATLVASFSLVALLVISSAFMDKEKADSLEKNSSLVKDLVTFILTAQTGLIGTALGFYFGSKSND
ncbi:hypothetical protein BCD64_10380 [Nostoc sp. MBR 210]|nr:hypothetical protein BCD64_10380 [Nostoc sp. MBR 210]